MLHEISHRITFSDEEVKVAIERYLREVRDIVVQPHELRFMDDQSPDVIVTWKETTNT
jgi:hypothetical protein